MIVLSTFHALLIARCWLFVSPSLYPSVNVSNAICEQVMSTWSYSSLGTSPLFMCTAVVVFIMSVYQGGV